MKRLKLFGLSAAAVLALVLLSGCGKSGLRLTVNDDGSFHADVTYGIDKSLMANDEVKQQLVSLITDALEQNGVAYAQEETDEFVFINVERDFADAKELANADAWRGIGMVPGFSSSEEAGKLWIRYEDGLMKIDGTLDAAAFGAEELVSQGGEGSAFEGSFSVVLPKPAAETNGEQSDPKTYEYVWRGTAEESKAVSISYELPDGAPLPEAAAQSGAKEGAASDEDKAGGPKDRRREEVLAIALLAAAAVILALVIRRLRKKEEAAAEENAAGDEKKDTPSE